MSILTALLSEQFSTVKIVKVILLQLYPGNGIELCREPVAMVHNWLPHVIEYPRIEEHQVVRDAKDGDMLVLIVMIP